MRYSVTMVKCKVSWCERTKHTKGYCNAHYCQQLRTGEIKKINPRRFFNDGVKAQECTKLYQNGVYPVEIARRFGINKSTVYVFLNRKDSDVNLRSRSEAKKGLLNPMWVENPSVGSIHRWVRRNYSKPRHCEECLIVPPLDLANISPKYNPDTYTRDLKNWEWLCRKCHMTKDGRLSRMYHGGAKPKYFGCKVDNCTRKHEAKGFCSNHYQNWRYHNAR